MFKLTLADVKTKGLKALNEGRLSAQGPRPECAYRDEDGRPCVVGAAFPKRFINKLDDGSQIYAAVSNLVVRGLIEIPEEEYEAINRLQKVHDRWAQVAGGKVPPNARLGSQSDLWGLDAEALERKLREELSA